MEQQLTIAIPMKLCTHICTNEKVYDIILYSCTYVPEGVDTVDDTRHVLSVVQVGRDWIEDLYIRDKVINKILLCTHIVSFRSGET